MGLLSKGGLASVGLKFVRADAIIGAEARSNHSLYMLFLLFLSMAGELVLLSSDLLVQSFFAREYTSAGDPKKKKGDR